MMIRTRNPYTRLFHDLFGDIRPTLGTMQEAGGSDYGLALDVEETQDGYTVRTDLPGICQDGISVNTHDDVLSITAESSAENKDENSRMLIRERAFGKFSRSLRFPVPVNGEAIQASYDSGVLTIAVPKAEHVKPREIPVSINSGAN